jgi:ribosome maturation factor RimP
MKFTELEAKIEDLVDPLLEEELKLVSVEVRRRNKKLVVSIYLDREGGIDLDTCARMNEEIGRHLDVEDLIKESYDLEVCSPGLDRILKKPREYNVFVGRKIELWLQQPFEGRNKFTGTLLQATEKGITLGADSEELVFEFPAIKKARLLFEWEKSLEEH